MLFEQKWFTIVISLIWGIGIALLFKRQCKNAECIIIRVPPQVYQNGMVIRDKNNRCYKLEKYNSTCVY